MIYMLHPFREDFPDSWEQFQPCIMSQLGVIVAQLSYSIKKCHSLQEKHFVSNVKLKVIIHHSTDLIGIKQIIL